MLNIKNKTCNTCPCISSFVEFTSYSVISHSFQIDDNEHICQFFCELRAIRFEKCFYQFFWAVWLALWQLHIGSSIKVSSTGRNVEFLTLNLNFLMAMEEASTRRST